MKKILAVAIASAFATPAFAATSNVDIYGILNVGIYSMDDNGYINGNDRNLSVTSQASRLGFKGSEDLGGGLSAIWQIESGFNVDETSGTIGSRNTFVGLKGGFGTILAGKHDTPMKMVGRKVDNFGDTMADSRNILGSSAYSDQVWDLRTPNTIAYISPNFSGLTATAAYVASWDASGTNNIDDNDVDAYSLNAIYENGPLMVGGAYEKHNDGTFDESMWRVVAGYKFGDFKLAAQYESADSDDDVQDRNAYGVFANYSMGAITLKANYLRAGDYKGSTDSGAKQFSIGADYALSKRTTVYALYAKVTNDNNDGYFSMGIGGGTSDRIDVNANGNAGDDVSAFGIGVKHSF
jgi:predicted porin